MKDKILVPLLLDKKKNQNHKILIISIYDFIKSSIHHITQIGLRVLDYYDNKSKSIINILILFMNDNKYSFMENHVP